MTELITCAAALLLLASAAAFGAAKILELSRRAKDADAAEARIKKLRKNLYACLSNMRGLPESEIILGQFIDAIEKDLEVSPARLRGLVSSLHEKRKNEN